MTASQIFILFLFTTTAPRDRRTKCYIRHYHRSWDDQQVISCSSGRCISTKHPYSMKKSTSRYEETWKTRKKCIFVYRCCQQVYKNLPSLLEDVRNFATGMRCIKTVPPHRKNTQPIYQSLSNIPWKLLSSFRSIFIGSAKTTSLQGMFVAGGMPKKASSLFFSCKLSVNDL